VGIRTPLGWSRTDRARLRAAIDVFRADIRVREVERGGPWVTEATQLLDAAETRLESSKGGWDEAWTYYQAAMRYGVAGLTPREVWAEQQVVLADATAEGKLNQWRRDVVMKLLDPSLGTWWGRADADALLDAIAPETKAELATALFDNREDAATAATVASVLEAAPRDREASAALASALVQTFRQRISDDRVLLSEAMLVRDEAARNGYRRGRLLRQNVLTLAAAAAVLAVFLVVLAFALPVDLDSEPDSSSGRLWLYGFLLGGLAGAVSATQRLTARGTRGRLPELREYSLLVLVLPMTGAAAGLAAVPLATAGIIPVKPTVAAVLAVSFAAGFSERLIVRAVDTVAGSGAKSSG
jgi:hypothetical protein